MTTLHELARRWWSGELGAAGTLLDVVFAPAEALYRVGSSARNAAYDRGRVRVARAAVPVISIGNIAVGGTGKTPFASWVAQRLRERGERPVILHGGYARDEPALHRKWTPDIPVIEEADRALASHRATTLGATVVVLDDGFQHRRLHRDLDIVLVAAERWSRTTRLLPRGPWREPPQALRRADLVVVTRKAATPGTADEVAAEVQRLTGTEAVRVHLRPAQWLCPAAGSGPAEAPPAPALLVTGVADPLLFEASARAAGAAVAGSLRFGDHHDYGAADARRVLAAAGGRPIVTTEKDWTKLERWLGTAPVWVLQQQVVVEAGADRLAAALEGALR